MTLRAKCNAGTRGSAQNAAYPFQTFCSLRTNRLGNANLPCGELHFHGQPPLFPQPMQSRWEESDCIAFRRHDEMPAIHLLKNSTTPGILREFEDWLNYQCHASLGYDRRNRLTEASLTSHRKRR